MQSKSKKLSVKSLFAFIITAVLVTFAYYYFANTDSFYTINLNIQKIVNQYLNKNNTREISTILNETINNDLKIFQFYNKPNVNNRTNYIDRILSYFSKWKKSLSTGKSHLEIYLDLLDDIHELVIEEQKLDMFNVTERPIPLSDSLNCVNLKYREFLTSSKRQKPARIIDLIIFGYELTMLEMRMYELYDAIDEFVVFETNITFRRVRKPYFFKSNLKRFQRFLDKVTLITPYNITYFNKNDSSIAKVIDIKNEDIDDAYKYQYLLRDNQVSIIFSKPNFEIEVKARMTPIELYTKYIRPIEADEIIIHGDTDELISGEIIYHFKHCVVKEDQYPYGSWSTFYIYNFNHLFSGDFPAGDQFSTQFPNVLHLQNIYEKKIPRLTSKNLLPRGSGCHCNRFFTTFAMGIYKGFSQSDGGRGEISGIFLQLLLNGTKEALDEFKRLSQTAQTMPTFISRINKIKQPFNSDLYFVPWIVKANQHVYKDYIIESNT